MERQTRETQNLVSERVWGFKSLPGHITSIFKILFILLLMTAGHHIVLQRSFNGSSPWVQMSNDSLQYIAMAEGKDVGLYFGARKLVPFLASLLPMSPDQALRFISYVCLFIMYIFCFKILEYLRFETGIIFWSLVSLFVSLSHLLIYQNPFLIDAFTLMCLTAMFYFALTAKSLPFGIVSILGALGHEAALFGVPAFLATKRFGIFFIVAVLSFAVFAAPRFFGWGDIYSPFGWSRFGQWVDWAKIFFAYGFLWLAMGIGLYLCPLKSYPAVALEFAFLLFGAFLSSLFASDIVRMFAILQPVALVLWAYFIQGLAKQSRFLFIVFCGLLFANLFLVIPTLFLSGSAQGMNELEEWYYKFQWVIGLHQGAGILLCLGFLYLLRRQRKLNEEITLVQRAS